MNIHSIIKRDLGIPLLRLLREDKPSHLIKRSLLSELAKRYQLKVLVETGTYLGEMVRAHLSTFEEIYSIELDTCLYEAAQKRFKSHKHVHVIQGDSGIELTHLIEQKSSLNNVLFWLDGHFSAGITAKASKDTPIVEELKTILRSSITHYVAVVDDLSSFDGTHDYPTIDELKKILHSFQPDCSVEVSPQTNSIIVISPVLTKPLS